MQFNSIIRAWWLSCLEATMKAIHNGLRYDTSTAEQVADWENGYQYSDFHYCCETLYRTAKGNWFLHGQGGARSEYAVRESSNTWGGSQRIIPMTAEEALSWCEDRGQVDAIEEYWPDSVEDA